MGPYASTGEGYAVVLVNGLGNLKEAWRETIASFSRYFRVIGYDYRNQGKDIAGHGSDYDVSRHAQDLDALARHLGLERFAGIGISTGTRILVEYAEHHPDRVGALAVMGLATENLAHRNRVIFSSWLAALARSTDDNLVPYVETYIPWIYGPDHLSAGPVPVEQIAAGLAATMTVAGTAANIAATRRSLGPRAGAETRPIAAPTLILQGEYDLMCPPRVPPWTVRALPRPQAGGGRAGRPQHPRREAGGVRTPGAQVPAR